MNMDTQGMPVQPRITLFILLTLLLIGSWSPPGQSAEALPFVLGAPFNVEEKLHLNAEERRWLDDRAVLNVGIPIADYEPINITTDQNRYQGISADYLSLISAKLSIPIKITGFSRREEELAALMAGKVDLLARASGSEGGKSDLIFSQVYMPDRSVVVGRSADSPLKTPLKSKRIAVLNGYVDEAALNRAYPDSLIVLAPTLHSGMEALAQGDVDAFVGNEVIVRAYLALRPYLKLSVQFESALAPSGLSFALRGDDIRLKSLVDRALDDLDESVGREIQRRWTAGLGDDVVNQRIRLSPQEQRWVRRHPQVTVASTQLPPYIYQDEKGRWVGLNIDLLERISRMTGLIFRHDVMPSTQAALEALSAGKADMNTTLAETAERRMQLNFSYAYGGNNWVYVVRANRQSPTTLGDLSGKVLAMPRRHALVDFLQRDHPDIRLKLVATYADAQRLVETGDAQATIQNEAGAWASVTRPLKVGRSVEGLWSPDRFVVSKTQPELLSILNKALDEFPVAEMRAIRMKWLGSLHPPPPIWSRPPVWVYGVLAVVGVSWLVSLFWRARIRVLDAQCRRAEEQLNDHHLFLCTLLDALPDAVYVRDLQGRLVTCNRAYEERLGISFEQLHGRRLTDIDLLPRKTAEAVHATYMDILSTGEPVRGRAPLTLVEPEVDVFQWVAPFYRANGELQGVVGGWAELPPLGHVERERAGIPRTAVSAGPSG